MKNSNGMKTFKKISIHFILLIILIVPFFVHGQGSNSVTSGSGSNSVIPPSSSDTNIRIPNPTNAGSTLMELLTALLNNVVMPVAAVAVVIWIVWAGFTYVTAQGNPKKVEEAHQRLLWSLVGAGILLGAAGISAVVQSTITGVLK